jgi:hypothetical protein
MKKEGGEYAQGNNVGGGGVPEVGICTLLMTGEFPTLSDLLAST